MSRFSGGLFGGLSVTLAGGIVADLQTLQRTQVPSVSSVYEFGAFRLDSAERLLLRAGQPISLTPKAFDLLVYLVERSGRLVTKQELLSAIWPDAFVEETNLTYTVSALRKALGDGQDGELLIQTVPTRGYRFVAPVTREGNPSTSSTSQTRARWSPALMRRIGIAGLAVAVIAILAILVRDSRETTVAPPLQRFAIPLPDSVLDALSPETQIPVAQISPDGRRVAFLVRSAAGILDNPLIWLRNIDAPPLDVVAVSGSEGALSLFWAPDSQHLGFLTRSAVKKLRLSDGTIHTLCGSCQPFDGGGTWSRSGLIVFASVDGPLLGIRDGGGEPEAITHVDRSGGEVRHLSPHFLPDGRRFLYVIRNADASRSGLHVGQVGSAEHKLLFQGEQTAIWSADGYLLFPRADHLVARPFDLARLEFTGDPIPLFPLGWRVGRAPVSVSDTGVLTHSIVEYPLLQFQWVRRTGELQQLVGEPGDYSSLDLSPDGRRLAFSRLVKGFDHVIDGRIDWAGHTSLWVHDLEQGLTSPWTFGDSAYTDPRWRGNSQRLLAKRWEPRPQAIVQISPDGSESVVSESDRPNALDDVSTDGEYLLYRHRGLGLLAMPLRDASKPIPVRKAPSGSMDQAQFSPDMRWIAYNADETNRFEVYVTPFPARGEHQRISSGGGVQPVWRHDGRELYYLGLNGWLHAVEVRPDGERLRFTDRELFQTGLVAPSPIIEQYAASADGRFLILKPVNNKVRNSIGVVLNWPALLTAARSR